MKIRFLFLFFLCTLNTFSQDIYFEHLRVEDGLSQSSALSLYQDEFGSMWIATRDGLNRYNGKDIEIFKPVKNDPSSIYSNNVRTVCGDRNGHLFLRSKFSVSVYDLKKEKFTTIKSSDVQTISYGIQDLWIATQDSIFSYNPETHELSFFYAFPPEEKIQISAIFQSSEKDVYIGTQGKGTYAIDRNKKIMNLINNIYVNSFFEDINKTIWITTRREGLFKLGKGSDIVNYTHKKDNPESISSNFIRTICMDNLGIYWIGTSAGLDRFDPRKGTFKHYEHSESNPKSISNSSIWSLLKDNQGTIWIGSYFGGVDFFNPEYGSYNYYNTDEANPSKLSSSIVSRMIEDKSGNLWIGTEGGGLNYLDRKTKTFKTYRYIPNKNSISNNIVKTLLYEENEDILWIGTHLGGINRLNLKTMHFDVYRNEPENPYSLREDGIRHLLPYGDSLIIATLRGLIVFDKNTKKFSNLLKGEDDKFNNRQIQDAMIDKNGRLWFSISEELYRYNLQTERLEQIFQDHQFGNSISVIYQDSFGRIWIGSTGSGIGLLSENNDYIYFYNTSGSGLLNDYINDIKESKSGYLLICTNQGFSRFDVENKKFYNYNSNNGFPFTATNEFGLYVTKDNEVFVGGVNGLVSFYETELVANDKPAGINFVNLWINNERIIPDDNSGILKYSLYYTDKIELNYNHAIISIDYAITSYTKFLKTDIQYKLEGFDKDWTDANYRNSITYTNLNPGKYTLLLKTKKNQNESGVVEKKITIVVNPPFYKTVWAYLILMVIIIVIIGVLFNFYTSKMKLRTSLEFEKKEKQQIEELNQSKLRFFTNISHEFRTPLTIISGQLEMLLQMSDIKPSVYNKLVNVFRNTNRMKKLINELLDFRKQEQGYLNIKASKQDLISFLYEIFITFKDYAAFRNIRFSFNHKEENLDLWFDITQMEKVFYNLLSNAFKYTPNGGCIDLSVETHSYSVFVTVSDNGKGIAEIDINKIFDRFYQVDNIKDNLTKNVGSGIGLAVCKGIIELHKGKISVVSKENQGSKFIVELLMGEDHLSKEEKDYSPNKNKPLITIENEKLDDKFIHDVKESQVEVSSQSSVMLIVEDDDDVRTMLEDLFTPFYKVIIAVDGDEGFQKTKENQPDIVLSDVMMPRVSGIDMCLKIKTDVETCHIPVVLLTAQTAIEYTVEGLKTGADDYVTKPFNVRVLVSRCNNLVNNRKMLQAKYTKDPDTSLHIISSNPLDQEIIDKIYAIIEENISNINFDVNVFAKEMGLGRSNLFSKIKGLTGQTPNELITSIRLKKSIYLLQHRPDLSVSEISYDVGFSSPSYYIKCFRECFNQTPAGFRKDSLR